MLAEEFVERVCLDEEVCNSLLVGLLLFEDQTNDLGGGDVLGPAQFVQFNSLTNGNLPPILRQRDIAAARLYKQFIGAYLYGLQRGSKQEFVFGDANDWHESLDAVFELISRLALDDVGAVQIFRE